MGSQSLVLFEHESIPYCWTEGELAAVERLNRRAGSPILQPQIRNGRPGWRTTQYVGLVRLGATSFQILPKLYQSSTGEQAVQAREAARHLLYLLAHTQDLGVQDTGLAAILQYPGDWFEGLIALFTTRLSELWQRGPQRAYQPVADELPILKGKWRIPDQIRRPEQLHRLAVLYDEFTLDQPLNRLLRAAVELLWRLARDNANRRRLDILREWMDPVTLVSPTVAAHMALPPLTRLNRHYAPLLNLARLLLHQAAPQLTGGRLDAFAFVFDMNHLFEGFLTQFIQRHHRAILPPALTGCRLLAQAEGVQHYLARRSDGKHAFLLRPDLVARLGERTPLLVDMKYKRLDPTQTKLGVDPSDFYQMVAYAHRYGCPSVLLLYPQLADMAHPLHHTFYLHDSPTRIVVHTVNLCRDLTTGAARQQLIAELAEGVAHAV